jgi:phage regulator Rha-like protein
MPEHLSDADFLAYADAIRSQDAALSPLIAGLVVAISQGIAADSRTFAKLFGIEHALVLREINQLTGPDVPIEITRRDGRTQRSYLKLTVKGEALCRLIP